MDFQKGDNWFFLAIEWGRQKHLEKATLVVSVNFGGLCLREKVR